MKSGNKLGLYSCHGQGNNQVHNLLPGSYDVIFSDSRKSAKAQCFFFSYKKQAKARLKASVGITSADLTLNLIHKFFNFCSILCCLHMAKSCGKVKIALIIPNTILGPQLSLFHVMVWKEIKNGFMIKNP